MAALVFAVSIVMIPIVISIVMVVTESHRAKSERSCAYQPNAGEYC
jgi:hypothetical protein